MPFTASHPAAVLPLLRRGSWVSAALLTGSMAPDLPSFLPVGLTHEQTHPLQAILWPDFLLGTGLLLAWWVLLRPGLAPLWPAAASRCGTSGWRSARAAWRGGGPGRARSLARWTAWVVLSELVGLATHLGWDAFTHEDGFVALHWAALSDRFARHAAYDWLQGISSVVGLAIVGWYLLVRWRRTQPAPRTAAQVGPHVRVVVVAATAAVTLVTGWAAWRSASGPHHGHLLVWSTTIKDAGGALLACLALWSIVWSVARTALHLAARPHSREPANVP